MTKRQERLAHNEERETYSWRGEPSRETGPVDKSWDPDRAQQERDARSVPKPRK